MYFFNESAITSLETRTSSLCSLKGQLKERSSTDHFEGSERNGDKYKIGGVSAHRPRLGSGPSPHR